MLRGIHHGSVLGPPRGGRVATAVVWALVGAWALWALIRVAGLERGFPLVPLLAFTPYVAAASVLPLAVAIALRRAAPACAATVVFLVLAAVTLPRAFGGAGERAPGPTLRVLSSNIEFGEGNPKALVELVRKLDVDVLAVQELTQAAVVDLRRVGLERTLSATLLAPATGVSGGGIYSRLPLDPLPVETLPGGFRLPRATVAVEGATPIEVAAVHAVPPTASGAANWDDDLSALPPGHQGPHRVLAGDFNATLDHAALRGVLDNGYEDAADALGEGFTPTWPHGRALPPPVTIDHVLYDTELAANDYSVHDVPGSDHRAVFAELILPPR